MVGFVPSFVISLLDFCKGIIPVLIAKNLGISLPYLIIIGLVTIAGHDWSIFLGFKGGKGTLTSLGASVVLLPFETLLAFSLWLFIVHYILKIRFVGSLIAFLLIPFFTWLISCRLVGEPKYLLLFPLGVLFLFLIRMPENIKNFFLKVKQ
jgi:glycerol-3-phosphate acyltransferase PlsY